MKHLNVMALITLLAGTAWALTTLRRQDLPSSWVIAEQKTQAQLRAQACTSYPSQVCLYYNTTVDDLFTSTGSAVGQFRNVRTGEGP